MMPMVMVGELVAVTVTITIQMYILEPLKFKIQLTTTVMGKTTKVFDVNDDGDSYSEQAGDCDDNDPSINPDEPKSLMV